MNDDFSPSAIDLAREGDFSLGSLGVRPSVRQIQIGDASETLEPRIMQVLVALARRRGEVVSRDELIETCWGGVAVSDGALHRCISQLRKLGDASNAFSLETIAKVGYRMRAASGDEEERLSAEMVRSGLAAPPPKGNSDASINRRQLDPGQAEVKPKVPAWWRKRPLAQTTAASATGVAALMLLLAALAIWQSDSQTRVLESSIAVLPFANLSSDPERDYLARGIAMEIIDKLSQLNGIEVISRNSSFGFGADADPRKVGGDLKVAHVLTGTVREEDGRINVTAVLVDAERGTAIWTQPYQGDFTTKGLDAVQRQIAAKVAGAMSIAFNVDKRERPSGSGTQNLDAYDFYLRGLDMWWYRFDRDLAEDLFTRAIELDPNYADAWAGRAITAASRWRDLPPAEARLQFDEAYTMARRAVDLDPNVSFAQAIFGAISTAVGEWGAAEEATLQALKISRSEMALNNRQMLLLRTGRLTEAYSMMLELRQVDPLRGPDNLALVQILSAIGRHDELRDIMSRPEWAEVSNTEISRLVDLVTARINAGDPPESVRQALESMSRRQEEGPAKFARAILAVFGNSAKARAVLSTWYEDESFELSIKWDLIPFLAAFYGDTDLVLRMWREELPITTPRTVYIWGPAFSAARARPEFKALMTEIGLVDYWRAYGWADKCLPLSANDFECK